MGKPVAWGVDRQEPVGEMAVPSDTPMKRTLSLLLGLSLFGAASVVAQETKKEAPKKAAAPAVKLPVQPADVAAPKLDPKTGAIQEGFAKSHEAFVAVAKKGEAQVVFLGDSITAGWNGNGKEVFKEYAKYNAANFGIGGDRVQHVLWRVENGEFDGIKPKAVVLMIGTNNSGTAENSPEQIANGIKAIIAAIHKRTPDTKVLLLAVFPRGAGEANNPGRAKNKAVNALIAKFDDGQKVHYFDIGPKFLQPDGTLTKDIMPDLLHLSPKGYQIEADAIREKLASLVK
jgi:lysophospholipase L1-like esterase